MHVYVCMYKVPTKNNMHIYGVLFCYKNIFEQISYKKFRKKFGIPKFRDSQNVASWHTSTLCSCSAPSKPHAFI